MQATRQARFGKAGTVLLVRAGLAALLVCAVVAVVMILGRPAGGGLVRDVATFYDKDSTQTIDDVTGVPFRETGASVEIGFALGTHWVRLQIDPDPAGEDVLIRLRPMPLDHAVLYAPDGAGGWTTSEGGELVDTEAQSWPSLMRHSLRLPAPEKPTTVYLKIDTLSPAALFVTAYPVSVAAQMDARIMVFHTLVFSVKAASILLILLTLPKRGNGVNLAFLALEGVLLAYLLVHLGYVRSIFHDLPPWLLDHASVTSATAMVAVSALFHRAFLGRYAPHPVACFAGSVQVGLGVAGFVLVLLGARLAGQGISTICYVLTLPCTVAMLVTLRRDTGAGLGAVYLAYGTYLPINLMALLTNFGIVQANGFHRNNTEINALVASTVLLLLVLSMNRTLNSQWEDQRREMRRAILARRAEVRQRQVQHRVTRLVANETRLALADLRLISHQPRQERSDEALGRAFSAMEDIVAASLQADEAETGQLRATAFPFDAVALVRRIVAEQALETRVDLHTPERLDMVSDSELVMIAFRHLLMNACTYGTQDEAIGIYLNRTSRGPATGLSLAIFNMVPDGFDFDPDHVFDKFYRGRAASTQSGTGLGLFICREIVTLLGGTIRAERVGRRVGFDLWLPERL